MHKGN